MSGSLIEQCRQYHEDIELAEKVASRVMLEKAKHPRGTVMHPLYDHAIKQSLAPVQEASRRLLSLYADNSGLRRLEIAILAGQERFGGALLNPPATGDQQHTFSGEQQQGSISSAAQASPFDRAQLPPPPPPTTASSTGDDDRSVWVNFYDQLKAVKDFHRSQPESANFFPDPGASVADNAAAAAAVASMTSTPSTLAAEAVNSLKERTPFPPEEHSSTGKRVDLMPFYLQFTNLGKLRRYREARYREQELARLRKKLLAKRQGDSGVPCEPAAIAQQLEESALSISFQEIDFIGYLGSFDDFGSIPRYCKYRDDEYIAYLTALREYFQGYFQRVNPLANFYALMNHLLEEFKDCWAKKSISAWSTPTHTFELYCLPTDRLFASQGTLTGHKKSKKYDAVLNRLQGLSIHEQRKHLEDSEAHDEVLALNEFIIQRFHEIFEANIQNTIQFLQKKQSRTLRELQMGATGAGNSDEEDSGSTASTLVVSKKKSSATAPDEEEDNEDNEDNDDNEEEDGEGKAVYNPLNLPLGWDGKPIPYWLYKLHGLGVEYKCEICGNYSYWGRRAFDRHFQEWRHAFGMRCLKIPNTIHFKEITKIEDAMTLYEKLKRELDANSFKADQDVECEDEEGNVMNVRAYEDLQRQRVV